MCDALDTHEGVYEKTNVVSYESYCPDCEKKHKIKEIKRERKHNGFYARLLRKIGRKMMDWGQ
jgi:hypothetical protein